MEKAKKKVPKTTGEMLKKKRKEADLTQKEVAKILGITQETYSSYERDKIKSYPSDKLMILAEYYDCTVDELLNKQPETQ